VLWEDKRDQNLEPPSMRAATAEGYAVIGRCTTAAAVKFTVRFIFSEE